MRTAVRGILFLIFSVVTFIAVALLYRAYRQDQNSPIFAISSRSGINEGMFIRVGGIDQWITVRGQNRNNPVILLLHGGPGLATSMLGEWFIPWEKQFTVVQWDQRGAGKTFGRYGRSTPDMSMSKIVADGIEVTEFLRRHLRKDKIIILGHSWGSMVGLSMAATRPNLFSAYVGMGQAVGPEGENIAYGMALESARKAGDAKNETTLKAIGLPPYQTIDGMSAARNVEAAYAPASERSYLTRSVPTALFAPGYSLGDIYDNARGGLYSLPPLYHSMTVFNARALGTKFSIPVIFIQGSADTVTPTSLVRSYFNNLVAPKKRLIVLAGDGHLALLTDTNRVLKALVLTVRPLADPSPAN